MNFTLKRTEYGQDGVFGELSSDDTDEVFTTLEHAFERLDGPYRPKLNAGIHICTLGTHNLDHSQGDLLYEINNVPGHSGILIHVGNYNRDSDGCVLIGTALGNKCITGSRTALATFMALQGGQEFTLTVLD